MSTNTNPSPKYVMPAEWAPHAGTMMAWPTEFSILQEEHVYPGSSLSETRKEVASIAQAIAKFEPLHLFVRDSEPDPATPDTNLQSATALLQSTPNITIHTTPNVHSLWTRDSGPVFVRSQHGPVEITYSPTDAPGIGLQTKSTLSSVVGLCMGFNNWGKKNHPNSDMFLAATATQTLGKSAVLAPFIAEGGAIEVDGEGTMLATESSILNPNRNPGIDKGTMEGYLRLVLGVEKVVWLPGRRGVDITDDHIDITARFVGEGVVLLSRAVGGDGDGAYASARKVLDSATDARGRRLRVVDVLEPDPEVVLGEEYDAGSGPTVSYLNYLVVNGGVVMAAFGDEERDREAARVIGEYYPERKIEQVYLHQLAAQGGGIHCSTQHIVAE